jgi:hypothetical protein
VGKKGSAPGHFDCTYSIELGRQGLICVADRGNSRVQIFDLNGKYLREWKSAQLGCPWAVTVSPDDFAYGVDGGDAYLKQSRTNPNPTQLDRARVLKVGLDGKIVAALGKYGRYDGQFIWSA